MLITDNTDEPLRPHGWNDWYRFARDELGFAHGESAEYAPGKARHLYLVPAAGSVDVNGVRVNARDGAAITDETKVKITALEDSELVLVDAA